MKAQFKHDCTKCKLVGVIGGHLDIYLCIGEMGETVVCRSSDEPGGDISATVGETSIEASEGLKDLSDYGGTICYGDPSILQKYQVIDFVIRRMPSVFSNMVRMV